MALSAKENELHFLYNLWFTLEISQTKGRKVMKYIKNNYLQNITVTGVTCSLVLLAGLSGCSSSSSPAPTTPTTPATVTVKGTITSENNPEPGVTVTGYYSDTDTTASETTAADGTYTLTVVTTKAVSLQVAKNLLATLNFEKITLTANETGADQDMPTAASAQQAIDLALGVNTEPLAGKAWFVVDVTNAGGDVPGATISSNPDPDVEVYTLCDGTDSAPGTITIGPCAPGSRAASYIAYFNAAPGDINVTVGGETQTAPVRVGEITILEFEQ